MISIEKSETIVLVGACLYLRSVFRTLGQYQKKQREERLMPNRDAKRVV